MMKYVGNSDTNLGRFITYVVFLNSRREYFFLQNTIDSMTFIVTRDQSD